MNKGSGATTSPTRNAQGQLTCIDWDAYNANPRAFIFWSQWYEPVMDIVPELHWEVRDSEGAVWGLKPAERLLTYPQTVDSTYFDSDTMEVRDNTDSICYGLTADSNNAATIRPEFIGQYSFASTLYPTVRSMRSEFASLIAWYEANAESGAGIRVHTGSIVV